MIKFLKYFIVFFIGFYIGFTAQSVKADSYSVYDGNLSSSYASFFANYDIGYWDDYVIWRDGDYSYKMYVSDNLTLNGSTFTASSGRLYNFYYSGNYNTTQHITSQLQDNFTLTNNNHYVIYSSLGNYPKIERGLRYEKITLFTLVLIGVSCLIGIIYKFINIQPFGDSISK